MVARACHDFLAFWLAEVTVDVCQRPKFENGTVKPSPKANSHLDPDANPHRGDPNEKERRLFIEISI